MLAKEVFFTGENGQGKSNLLEALYFSAYGSSFRTHNDAELLRRGNEAAGMSVRAMYKGGGEEASHTTFITMENGRKKIERDGKSIKDRKELIYAMPCVLYNHDDLDFAEGSPERRRFFIDQTLSMYDLLYIDIMRKFRRILKSRNLCLKEKNYSLLDTYDVQLVQEVDGAGASGLGLKEFLLDASDISRSAEDSSGNSEGGRLHCSSSIRFSVACTSRFLDWTAWA